LVQDGKLINKPILQLKTARSAEGGLLGIALHPQFTSNRFFYLYSTVAENGKTMNRVERYRMASDLKSAPKDKIIIDNIPAARYHNGGRLHFGPDGMLYVATGDAGEPRSAQNIDSLAGKILRLTPDGDIPRDNPWPGKAAYIIGVRNVQGFDWYDNNLMFVFDHGPSGEMGLRGHDEVNHAQAGSNLGWPDTYACQIMAGMTPPLLTWKTAVPPGGGIVYRGKALAGWNGDLILASLGAKHLHRIQLDDKNPRRLQAHDAHLNGSPPHGFGRLREIILGPDDELYVTTSNCDGRGHCGSKKDMILRIVASSKK
jgi:glucose/arabinose dehydrogenase